MNRTQKVLKDSFIQLIYDTAKIEVSGSSYPLTKDIIEGTYYGNEEAYPVRVIRAIRDAYRMVTDIDNISQLKVDLNFLCGINKVVGVSSTDWQEQNTGHLRKTKRENEIYVSTSKGKYYPGEVKPREVSQSLKEILSQKDCVKAAIETMIFICKRQLFVDGNKRTAFIVANAILAKNDVGVLLLSDKDKQEYIDNLLDYYDDESKKNFLIYWIKQNMFSSLPNYSFNGSKAMRKDNEADTVRLQRACNRTFNALDRKQRTDLLDRIVYDNNKVALSNPKGDVVIMVTFAHSKREVSIVFNNNKEVIISASSSDLSLANVKDAIVNEGFNIGVDPFLTETFAKALHL